ncbi:phospholipase D-like domain-containing protein [Aquabacterium sp. UBA2148]|uniref:phospholipase D-like domain-containing protein n=1 Tax=Aquabacterium sp. UBA2148 TaxID=1946042 RepID=UPI00257B03A9|nr:phospholipase D-like domain-containing protein [Aquabacterium sp. UBA2148]
MSETAFCKHHDDRQVNVFIDETGQSWRTVSASQAAAHQQDITHPERFAPSRLGHQTKSFINGQDYFADVAAAMAAAKRSIFIAGWQVNWDVELVPGKRLIDVLRQALDASSDLRIYVMPWMSPKMPLNTGDFGTMLAVFQLNAGRNTMRAFCCPAGLQNDFTGVEETFFSHHQKQVVIDNQIAYIGGMDLAYGRRDDARSSLNHEWRQGAERYNPGIPPMRALTPSEMMQFVTEAELLQSTLKGALSFGLSAPLQEMLLSTRRASADGLAGQMVDRLYSWWQEPLPDWLTKPMEAIKPTIGQLLDEARTLTEQEVLRRLQQGTLTAADVQKPLQVVAKLMKAAYSNLLKAAWLNQAPHPDLLKPSQQSMPLSGAVLADDQPRQPWQDVHMRMEGPAVYDAAMNFIRRWNSLQHSYLAGDADLRSKVRVPDSLVPQEPAYTAKGPGTAKVRVLRSASLKLQQQERAAMPQLPAPQVVQHDIHDVMVRLILGATHFVYIESQFFQSRFGEPSINPTSKEGQDLQSAALKQLLSQSGARIKSALTLIGKNAQGDKLPQNQICWALGQRIEHAVRCNFPFHAFVVLPVHPEGRLDDLAIIGQIHWTMQSLVYGSHSLVNRVRCAIAAKKLLAGKKVIRRELWQAMLQKVREGKPGERPYEKVTPAEWAPYLTLLNLRNCEVVGGKVRTEQIYVHSKLLIVDDAEVVIGSANINDRSLNGDRDSELAVFVNDTALRDSMTHGCATKVCTFGHQLRVDLWRKHLALAGNGNAVVKPASALAGLMEQPATPQAIKLIQQIATANQAAYEKVFAHVPRSIQKGAPIEIKASIWPPVNRNPQQPSLGITAYANQMPFSEAFWKAAAPKAAPQGIQGFFTALPIEWTDGENNHPDMNKVLLTQVPAEGTYHAQASRHDTQEQTG